MKEFLIMLAIMLAIIGGFMLHDDKPHQVEPEDTVTIDGQSRHVYTLVDGTRTIRFVTYGYSTIILEPKHAPPR